MIALMAPLYPIAFVVIAYAYLGAPRTTRQSRAVSMLGAIAGVAFLRLIGFVSTVFGVNAPGCYRCNIWQRPSQLALGFTSFAAA